MRPEYGEGNVPAEAHGSRAGGPTFRPPLVLVGTLGVIVACAVVGIVLGSFAVFVAGLPKSSAAVLMAMPLGAVLGLIATPVLFVNALSPSAFAFIADGIGWQNAVYALLGGSVLTWVAIELMSRWYERARNRSA